MGKYTIKNETNGTIWWREGLWGYKKDLRAGQSRTIETDRNANITMFAKVEGKDIWWGSLWIPKSSGYCSVKGAWDWCIKQGVES